MTGGTPEAMEINRGLAQVAAHFGVAMGLGSGRVALEAPETLESFCVRSEAPDVLLFANLGAVQLNKGYGAQHCRRLVELLQADALVLHLNPLQEALQPEGDTNFRGLLRRISDLCGDVPFPVIVKEVGWGIGAADVRALFDAGVAAVDVAGTGGTSWSEVERHRIAQPWRARVAATFDNWGIPTARALVQAREAVPERPIVASGGIRNGLDVAKAMALGGRPRRRRGPVSSRGGPRRRSGVRTRPRVYRRFAHRDVLHGRAQRRRAASRAAGAYRRRGCARERFGDRTQPRRWPMRIAACCRDAIAENFSVASRFVNAGLRRELARIYAFCRTTDDLGDESRPGAALDRLSCWRDETVALFGGKAPIHPVLVALAPTIERHRLPAQPFLDLIEANVVDQHADRYATWDQLDAYCRLSAAPVGRMVLGVFDVSDETAQRLSDDVCIGLQLANHAQDVRRDAAMGRKYLVESDVATMGDAGATAAMVQRARTLLASGEALERRVPRALGLQLALYRMGGLAICDAIEALDYKTVELRPSVSTRTKLALMLRALLYSVSRRRPAS